MKKILSMLSVILGISLLISCSYPESYLYDLCKSGVPKEEIMDAINHDNFYEMVKFKGKSGYDPLFFAVYSYQDPELIQFFIRNGADVNVEYFKTSPEYDSGKFTFNYTTPLIWSVISNNEEVVKCLLDNGAKVNKKYRINVDSIGIVLDYINSAQIAYIMLENNIGDLIKNSDLFEESYSVMSGPGLPPTMLSSDLLLEALSLLQKGE